MNENWFILSLSNLDLYVQELIEIRKGSSVTTKTNTIHSIVFNILKVVKTMLVSDILKSNINDFIFLSNLIVQLKSNLNDEMFLDLIELSNDILNSVKG